MRIRTQLQYLLILFLSIANTGCEKEQPIIPRPVTGPATTGSTWKPPTASAGDDINLEIPVTSTTLSGTAFDPNGTIWQVSWRKISGPESYLIESVHNLSIDLIWLEEGIYEFEFKVTNLEGRIAKDTVKVTVSSNLRRHVLTNYTSNPAGVEIPEEVANNLKWVFVKSNGRCEQADNGPSPTIDYDWGGYYYELLPGNKIAINDDGEQVILYY